MRVKQLILTMAGILAFTGGSIALSPSFSGEDPCPVICAEAGFNPGNWSVYHSIGRLDYCNYDIALSFSAFSPLEDIHTGNTLRACTIDGNARSDAALSVRGISMPKRRFPMPSKPFERSVNETSSLGNSQNAVAQAMWNDASFAVDRGRTSALLEQLQTLLGAVDAMEETSKSTLFYIYSALASTSIGIYAGTGVTTSPIVNALSSVVSSEDHGDALVQACSEYALNNTTILNTTSSVSSHRIVSAAVGVAVASGPQCLAQVQRAVSRWANSSCVDEGYAHTAVLPVTLQTVALSQNADNAKRFSKRSTCATTEVQSGDLCADLARRCGISTADLVRYNSHKDFCTMLRVPQRVCCSAGDLPVLVPDANGNCKQHEVQADQNCWSIASDNSNLFSVDDLEDFNKNTWGWGGCNNLQASSIICLSPGNPPLPKPVPNAMCGPVKPGTVPPPPGTDLASLNPCPLNSCCDVWGFCGTTDEFCRPVPTGQAPGAPQPLGAPNCISNCGTDIVNNNSPPSSFLKIGYFEGYSLSRLCQEVDIQFLDTSKYTHIHFAFAPVTPGAYEVDIRPVINQFYYFKRISDAKKILSFGGWTFSTDPATYGIFREGVMSSNRDRLAQNIANFIISENLDGVDIDWEYPAAPDIPDIPTADPEEGENYYLFLQKLRSILPSSKSVSFAAPASYWYLRGFPIAKIINVVDYVVYMTYDLHGQWDYGNKWTDSGCPGGNCLRSHVNATETLNALSMITKAGVPTNKIVVGVTSYGRSFQMTDPQCTGPMCTYTGRDSGATPGSCTDTAGYISNAEIREILDTNPTARRFRDGVGSDVLVYNHDQWVSYMEDDTKAKRIEMYRSMNFLGTTDWAISLDNTTGQGSRDHNDDNDDDDDTGDLGLGRLPGLLLKEKLGKGVVQPQHHKNCKNGQEGTKQSWKDAGKIAKPTMDWPPDNKDQLVLDFYFGHESRDDRQVFFKRDGLSDNPDANNDEDDEDDIAWLAKMDELEKSIQEEYDPARINPGDFLPLTDEDDNDWDIEFECSNGKYVSTLQCALFCQGGLCTEAFDGYVFCSRCNATTNDDPPYKLEEFSDSFGSGNMSEWTSYKGEFSVSNAGLTAVKAQEAEAYIYQHKVGDFIYEADVLLPAEQGSSADADAGLTFRFTIADEMQNEAGGYYYAGIRGGHSFIRRMPAGVELASVATVNAQLGKSVHIKVQAVNETISLYVGDMNTPTLEATDAALRTGFNGVRAHETGATFSNISIVPVVRQRGIVNNCHTFYRAIAGDTCQTITSKHESLTLQRLHSWNPALQDDCSGLKTDYFYCVGREDAFHVTTKYHNDCSGDVHNDVVVGHDQGTCIDTGCSVASLDVASAGDCRGGRVQISYWEQPGCSGKWFGYGYTSRDTCRALWTDGWKFGSLHLRCADEWYDCVNQGTCTADPEPATGICQAPPKEPPAAFTLKARSHADCTGDVHKELLVEKGNGRCLNTGCSVGSLDIAELGDCPDDQIRISYWGGEDCAGAWYGYGYAKRNTCRTLWSAGSMFKSLWLSCAKQSDDCVSQGSCTADPEPARSIC